MSTPPRLLAASPRVSLREEDPRTSIPAPQPFDMFPAQVSLGAKAWHHRQLLLTPEWCAWC